MIRVYVFQFYIHLGSHPASCLFMSEFSGGGGGFFLACEDFGRIFDNSFPAFALKKERKKNGD